MSALRIVTATVVAILVLAATACGTGSHGTPGRAPARSPATSTVSPCEATVLALLGESAADLQDGDQGGLDPVQVMDRYGQNSAVYQAFILLDGSVLAAEEQNGNTGVLTPFVSRVRQLCAQYQKQP